MKLCIHVLYDRRGEEGLERYSVRKCRVRIGPISSVVCLNRGGYCTDNSCAPLERATHDKCRFRAVGATALCCELNASCQFDELLLDACRQFGSPSQRSLDCRVRGGVRISFLILIVRASPRVGCSHAPIQSSRAACVRPCCRRRHANGRMHPMMATRLVSKTAVPTWIGKKNERKSE